jgi:ketosteroid isomerase-like protein
VNQPAEEGRNRRIISRFLEVLETSDFDSLGDVCTRDVVQEIPQSGERVRGLDNLRAVFANYPGRAPGRSPIAPLQVLGEQQYVMTPTFNLVRVEGAGDSPVAVWKARYPDGSHWWVVVLITMRDDKIAKMVAYFAEVFSPPDWRARWVEPMDK